MYNFFNRLGHVEIISGENKTIFSSDGTAKTFSLIGHANGSDQMRVMNDLDFKFSISKVSDMSSSNSDAKVSLLGLSRETIQFLSTYKAQGVERQRRKRIRVYASYEDFGDNLIFDGDISIAKPTVPPDNWLEITAVVGGYRKYELFSKAVNGKMKISELLDALAGELDLKVQYVDKDNPNVIKEKNREIKGFDCTGTMDDIMRGINLVSDFRLFEDNGVLLARLDDVDYYRSSSSIHLSENTGIIGIPEILVGTNDTDSSKQKGVLQLKVKTLINPGIRMWDRVYLESVYLPDANGYYTVFQIDYEGQLRGQEWYQTMVLSNAVKA